MLYPIPIAVKPIEDFQLLVTFEDDENRIYDAKPLIKGDWFGQLRDISKFNTAKIVSNTVEWADGQDIAPDELYFVSRPVFVLK
ncbi:MAG: DUF2442 domain-containing protein [Treponema sp.]|nr:DUF2442 domain-containing protein [Treponema sp.]